MQHITMHHVWSGTRRIDQAAARHRPQGFWKKLWDHGWGLLFVVVMTLLSILGPRTAYSKLPPARPADWPAVHSLK